MEATEVYTLFICIFRRHSCVLQIGIGSSRPTAFAEMALPDEMPALKVRAVVYVDCIVEMLAGSWKTEEAQYEACENGE